jgi:hypothetical protein
MPRKGLHVGASRKVEASEDVRAEGVLRAGSLPPPEDRLVQSQLLTGPVQRSRQTLPQSLGRFLQLGGQLGPLAVDLDADQLGIARDRRRKNIRRHLPDAVDLIEICVSAGLGLDQSWNSVAEEIRRVCPTLADEMELTNLEISLGASRAVAMRHMAERTGAEDISSLVALLVQSERFGASIVDALRTFATTMRETWSRRAEEGAEQMAVKMLFPMVLFIFPALLIVMVGPAVLGFIQAMGSH